jgi:DNA modification methylase
MEIQHGDCFQLGNHRLVCGDCTNKNHVDLLFENTKIDIVFTSPPYWEQRSYTDEYNKHLKNWFDLMTGAFSFVPMNEKCQILVNLGLVTKSGNCLPYWEPWIDWMQKQNWRRFGWYVWDKLSGAHGVFGGRLAPTFEFVFHFNKIGVEPVRWIEKKPPKKKEIRPGLRYKNGIKKPPTKICNNKYKIPDSVIRIARNQQKKHYGDHPAVFPIKLPQFILRTWPGIVYDPFAGSGSTMIAAESLGLQSFNMEISPTYCQQIIKRWNDQSMIQATRVQP